MGRYRGGGLSPSNERLDAIVAESVERTQQAVQKALRNRFGNADSVTAGAMGPASSSRSSEQPREEQTLTALEGGGE